MPFFGSLLVYLGVVIYSFMPFIQLRELHLSLYSCSFKVHVPPPDGLVSFEFELHR
jgi:hypothetical protein